MKFRLAITLLLAAAVPTCAAAQSAPSAPAVQSAAPAAPPAVLVLRSKSLAPFSAGAQSRALRIDGLYIETLQGRVSLPAALIATPQKNGALEGQATMPDGRIVKLSVVPDGANFTPGQQRRQTICCCLSDNLNSCDADAPISFAACAARF